MNCVAFGTYTYHQKNACVSSSLPASSLLS